MLNQHGVVITAGQHMPIDLEQVTCLFECPKEFAVFVQDHHMAKSETQLDPHNSQGKGLQGGMFYRFHHRKARHSTTRYHIYLIPIKAGMIARFICVHKKNSK
jgi:hypothetical protein